SVRSIARPRTTTGREAFASSLTVGFLRNSPPSRASAWWAAAARWAEDREAGRRRRTASPPPSTRHPGCPWGSDSLPRTDFLGVTDHARMDRQVELGGLLLAEQGGLVTRRVRRSQRRDVL